MGNAQVKTSASFGGRHHGKIAKSVHWSHAERPPPPGKPRLVPEAHTQPGLVTIRWDPPPRHGGAPVTGYLVEHRRAGTSVWVRSSPAPALRPELTLAGLEPGWRYQFRVTADSAAGRSEPGEVSEPLTVTLARSDAQPPVFTIGLQDTVALENEKVEFVVQFRGTPQPTVSWFKDGFEIFSSRRMKVTTEAEQSSLVIFQAAFSDEGELKCSVTNRAGHAVTRCKIRLEAPPRIRLPRQYEDGLLYERDEVIRLKVSVLGRPLPRVSWYHNGEPVIFGGRHEVINTERGSQLRVAEARRSDRGEYVVKATSRLGEDHASVLVTVTDRPHPPAKITVVSALGRSVTLSWTVPEDDGGCKIGNYIVEYYRVGWNVWLKAATCRQLTTILGDLIEGSEYKFRVKAENPYGVSEPSPESEVVFIPDPKRGIMQPPAKSVTLERDVPMLPPGRGGSQHDLPVTPREPTSKRSTSLTRADDRGKQALVIDITGQQGRVKTMSPAGKPDVPEISVQLTERSEIKKSSPSALDKDKQSYELPKASKSNTVGNEFKKTETYKAAVEEIPTNVPEKPIRTSHKTSDMDNVLSNTLPSPKGKENKSYLKKTADEERPLPVLQHEKERVEKKKTTVQRGSSLGPREQDDQLMHGSSELMLLLVPHEEGKKETPSRQASQEQRDAAVEALSSEAVAPPMSLSAPELGGDDPGEAYDPGGPLRNAISSTELLHDRTNARFFQEAEQRRMKQDMERQLTKPESRKEPLIEADLDRPEEELEDSLEESDESADERDFEGEEQRAWRSRLQRGLADFDEDTYQPPRVLSLAIQQPPVMSQNETEAKINGAVPVQQLQPSQQQAEQLAQEQQKTKNEVQQQLPSGADEEVDEEAKLRAAAAEAARRRRMQSRQASIEEEEALRRAVSSHYGELISDLATRRIHRPRTQLLLDTEELKAAAEEEERQMLSPAPEEEKEQPQKQPKEPSPEMIEEKSAEIPVEQSQVKSILKTESKFSEEVPSPAAELRNRWGATGSLRPPVMSSLSTEDEEDLDGRPRSRSREDTPVVRERFTGATLGRPSPLLLHQMGRSRSSEDSYSYDEEDEPATVPTRYRHLEEDDERAPFHRDDCAPLRIPARASSARSSSREVSEEVDPERVYRERLEQLKREQREWEARKRREEQLWELRRRQLWGQPAAPDGPPPEVVQRRVRSWFEYMSDVALLAVASWLYLRGDELLAVPVLLLAVYRQLSAVVRRRLARIASMLPFRRRRQQ